MADSLDGRMEAERNDGEDGARDAAGLTEAEFLARYRTKDYPKAEPTADAVVFHRVGEARQGAERQGAERQGAGRQGAGRRGAPSEAGACERDASAEPAVEAQPSASSATGALEVLLVRRGGHPYLGCWAVPGGFVNPDEDADAACARELEEETGLAGVPFEQLGFYSTPGRDPRGWVVSSGYVAEIAGDAVPHAGDDAADARWFAVTEEPAPADVAASAGGALCHALRLTNGDEGLTIAFSEVEQPFSAPRAHVVRSCGLAFDHDRLIADAWLRVRGR